MKRSISLILTLTLLLGCFSIGVSASGSVFTDIKATDYYYDAVQWAYNEKITTGTSTTTFSPADPCTRGQIVTFLWCAQGCPEPGAVQIPFTDVVAGSFYEKAMLWAYSTGITTGTSATTFSPEDPCTRGQVATFLHRYFGEPTSSSNNPFPDVVAGEFYYDAVLWAVENKITAGIPRADSNIVDFQPNTTCNRAQIVTFLYRAIAN